MAPGLLNKSSSGRGDLIQMQFVRSLFLMTILILGIGLVSSQAAFGVAVTGNTGPRSEEQIRREYFTDIHDVDPSILVDLIYFSDFNFVGEKIDGYRANLCLLTHETAEKLKLASDRLKALGQKKAKGKLRLLVRDCYRPKKAVKHFLDWLKDSTDQKMKTHFYPHTRKQNLVKHGYIAPHSTHSRGSSVDVTVVEVSGAGENSQVFALDMGSIVDFFGTQAQTNSRLISDEAQRNRELLLEAMRPYFNNYKKEWWHFTLKNETFSGGGFDFDVEPEHTGLPNSLLPK